jgi:F-type H+-transporting ATPase subunit gamma
MTRLAEIEARVSGMSDLQDVVSAMRSLAGMRMREAQQALPGIRRHAAVIANAIADTLPLLPEPEQRAGPARSRCMLVVCMAEHGFVGGFNERVLEEIGRVARPDDMLFVLGTRGAALLFERGRRPAWSHPMPTRSRAVAPAIQALSAELYRQIARGHAGRVETLHVRGGSGEPLTLSRRLILPFDVRTLRRPPPRQAPLHTLAPDVLQERLIAEYIFALLTEAAVESISGENAARFSAMESAFDNVSRKLDALRLDARQARQAEITTEILELVTADAALTDAALRR